jgi:hypothetical protein
VDNDRVAWVVMQGMYYLYLFLWPGLVWCPQPAQTTRVLDLKYHCSTLALADNSRFDMAHDRLF